MSIDRKQLLAIALTLALACMAPAQRVPAASTQGVIISCDDDCIVAIDERVVGRVQKGHQLFFPGSKGTHSIAAATREGDLWEQKAGTFDEPAPVLMVSFREARSQRVSAEEKVSELQHQVTKKEGDLAKVKQLTPEMEAEERRLIVQAINSYSDRYGAELGMRDSRHESSQQLDDASTMTYIQSLGETNTTTQGTDLAVMGIEMLMSHHLNVLAHRNELAIQDASLRMQYLGSILEDPFRRPRVELGADYLTITRDVVRDKKAGTLATAPNLIVYSDSSGVTRLSCSDLRSAHNEKHLHLDLLNSDATAKSKKKEHSVVITAKDKTERPLLLGDVYLACPALTQ